MKFRKKEVHVYNEYDVNPVDEKLHEDKKRRRIKKSKVAIVIIVIVLIAAFFISDLSRIQSITITGNEMVSSDDINNSISVKAHKSVSLFTTKGSIKSDVESVPFISNCNVSKDFFGNVTIDVKETKLYGYANIKNVIYIFDSKGTLYKDTKNKYENYIKRLPEFKGFKKEKFENLVKEYIKLPSIVRNNLSQASYSPLTGDDDRMEFDMNDGKILYVRIDQMAKQLQKDNYAQKMQQYPGYKYYDFVGKYMYASN